ncbi:methyltransferase domain-containing protein [Candidatus Woesearchaeota archaeon]|nr:methyltransferase domain-containing protein [Candidatus Woesearchaeota archaeon]
MVRKEEAYCLADGEQDTYTLVPREDKELIDEAAIRNHWKLRAQRTGVQAVMSARHTIEENQHASNALQDDIFNFLDSYVVGKHVFELGVGIGRMTEELAKRAAHVTGYDMTPEMIIKARQALQGYHNVDLHIGKIEDVPVGKKYDLVFECLVLLHILNSEEVQRTIRRMQDLSDRVFIVEHTYEGPDFPISRYSVLRTPEEYEALFKPYRSVWQKEHRCVGDRFTMMLFEK